MKRVFMILGAALALAGCGSKATVSKEDTLMSIQIIDRNGFSETVSTKDRLSGYQKVDFCAPQPYQKVLRVFGKNQEHKSIAKLTSYHSNGHIKQYLEALDGRAHGIYREWHPSGIQKLELQLIEGAAELSDTAMSSWVFEGVSKVWDEQGHLMAEISYDKGLLQGDSTYYYPEGQVKKKEPYQQGKIHGMVCLYDASGLLYESIPYVQDQRQGQAKREGSFAYEELFDQDRLLKGSYFQGETLVASVEEGHGFRAEVDEESGKVQRLVEYKKGLPEGLVKVFDATGRILSQYSQKEGKKQGQEWIYYLQEDQEARLRPKLLLHWQEDMMQGVVKTWFPDGQQESQKELYQNKKNGAFFAWYRNGDLMYSEEYERDLLSSGTYYKKGDKDPVSRVIKGKGVATIYNVEGYFVRKVFYDKGTPSLEQEP